MKVVVYPTSEQAVELKRMVARDGLVGEKRPNAGD